MKTSRDDVVVDIDKERLISRMKQYFDPELGDAEIRAIMPTAMTSTARFDAKKTRQYLVKRGFKPENIARYCYRPFDNRWLYWEPETKLLDEKRSEYFPQAFAGNIWLSAGQRNRKDAFYQPQVTAILADHHLVESNVGMFPLHLRPRTSGGGLFAEESKPNLTRNVSSWLAQVRGEPGDLFFHCVAITHAPIYRQESAGALRQNWPRVPLPNSNAMLSHSAEIGRKLSALLDADAALEDLSGNLRSEPTGIGSISREGGGSLNPDAGDLDISVGWGHAGKGGAIMPGKGRVVERDYMAKEREAIAVGAAALGLAEERVLALLGNRTLDVYLNNLAYWRNIPIGIWDYTIGGYQVIKKWLSYREREILGRALKMDEARAVTDIARRIAAILLMEPELDANYEAIKNSTYPWNSTS